MALSVLALGTLIAGCGGGGGGTVSGPGAPVPVPSASAPVPSPTPTPPVAGSATIDTAQGAVIGQTGGFTPAEGDTSSGGQGQNVDGTTCDTTMSNAYHIHFYLGVFVNGTQMALPAGVGMFNPQPPDSTGFVNLATCFYHLHTHDESGIVHIEDPDTQGLPITQSMYTLQTFLDIWGITTDANHFGPFQGPVEVFTSGQVDRSNSNGGTVSASDLTYYGSDPASVPLYSHEVVYVEVGPSYPASLPSVHFYMTQ